VIDSQGRVIGIVTEFDILKALLLGEAGLSKVAEDIMRIGPICLDESQTIAEAVDLMSEHDIVPIPVVSNGRLIGIVSRTNVLRAFVKQEFRSVEESGVLKA
jgi:CBS domain-containing protein